MADFDHLFFEDPLLGGCTLSESAETLRALRGRLAWLDEQIAQARDQGDAARRTGHALSRAVCVLALRRIEYRVQACEDECRGPDASRHTARAGQDGRVQRSGLRLAQDAVREALAEFRAARDPGAGEGLDLAAMGVRGHA